MSEDNEVRRNR